LHTRRLRRYRFIGERTDDNGSERYYRNGQQRPAPAMTRRRARYQRSPMMRKPAPARGRGTAMTAARVR
jgi:hypothetical protein